MYSSITSDLASRQALTRFDEKTVATALQMSETLTRLFGLIEKRLAAAKSEIEGCRSLGRLISRGIEALEDGWWDTRQALQQLLKEKEIFQRRCLIPQEGDTTQQGYTDTYILNLTRGFERDSVHITGRAERIATQIEAIAEQMERNVQLFESLPEDSRTLYRLTQNLTAEEKAQGVDLVLGDSIYCYRNKSGWYPKSKN